MSQGAAREVEHLRDLSPQQWKSGIAAWLGWLFDGLDMHLYTLVAAPFVMQLLQADSLSDLLVKRYSSWIQASFLVGWALGGGFFGRLGDLLGRARYRGLPKVMLQNYLIGAACNVKRWIRRLQREMKQGRPQEPCALPVI